MTREIVSASDKQSIEDTEDAKRTRRLSYTAAGAIGVAAGLMIGFIFANVADEDSSLRVAEDCVTNVENARTEAEICDLWVEDGSIVMGPAYLNPEFVGSSDGSVPATTTQPTITIEPMPIETVIVATTVGP